MKKYRCLLVAMLLVCLVALTACGKDDAGATTPQSDFVYLAEYIDIADMPQGMDGFQYATAYGDTIYMVGSGVVGQREPQEGEPQPGDEFYYDGYYDVYGSFLCSVKADGSSFEQLPAFEASAVPDGQMGNANVSAMNVDGEGNIWIVENLYTYTVDAEGNWLDGTDNYILRKLDSTGAELLRADLSALAQEGDSFYVNTMQVDADSNVYVSDGNNTIFVLDPQGALLFSLSLEGDNWINSVSRIADGRMLAMCYEGGNQVCKYIDVAAKSWGETVDTSNGRMYNIINGSGDYDLYYQDGSNLWGYSLDSAESTKLVNWIDSDINGNDLQYILPLADGRIACLNVNYSYDNDAGTSTSEMEMILLSKHDRADVPERTILNMAVMWMDSSVSNAVIDFNKTNTEYRIKVQDYSEFNTEDDYNAGMLKLNTEIISGTVPDILYANGLPIQQYIAKGLLEDLSSYIEADSELKNGVVPQYLNVQRSQFGGVYQAGPQFYVYSVMGATPVVGADMGWTLDDVNALLAAHPGAQLFYNFTRDTVLYYSIMMSGDDFVDWQTGECSFDSDGFIKMLEFANSYPADIDWENWEEMESESELIASGQVLATPLSIGGFDEYQMYQAMYGGDITFKGFPCENGIGSVMSMDNGLAMSSTCQYKEGAWSFMRLLLSEDYQKDNVWYGFPTNQAAFDKTIEKAMEKETYTDETGNEVEVSRGGIGMNGFSVEIYASTQEDIDKFLALLDAVDSTMSYNENIMTIVQEEAAPYFAGQKSAADTAAVIQSRVKIYVSEQR